MDATDKKLRYMLSTRVEKSYAEAVECLLAHHGSLQFSKYLRGLIYADALKCGIPTADLDRPAWVNQVISRAIRRMLITFEKRTVRRKDGDEMIQNFAAVIFCQMLISWG
jgi:hypothetical protein